MWNANLCVNTSPRLDLTLEEQIRLFKKIGFDGFFINWFSGMDLKPFRALAQELDMIFQSVHAPFAKVNRLWEPMEDTSEALEEQLQCLRASADAGVDLVVLHPFIGFKKHEPTQFGIDHYRIIVEEAKKLGIRLAIENTEGEEYLDALMDAFRGEANVGFCWDTGHEMCYNHHKDLLAKYGNRLFCTHLNDNLGIKDRAGEITFHDDLHLLPFDGVADWQDIANRLNRCGYEDCLTFELKVPTTLNGCTKLIYDNVTTEEYFIQAYIRACRVAALKVRHTY